MFKRETSPVLLLSKQMSLFYNKQQTGFIHIYRKQKGFSLSTNRSAEEKMMDNRVL